MILGQGESSRLNVAVVRRDRAAVATQVFMTSDRNGPGVLLILGIANQGVVPQKVDSLIAGQIDSLRAGGVTAEELTKAKNTLRASFIRERETALNKAEELHHYLLFHDSLAEINTELDRVLAVTADDVRRVTAKYFDPANAVVMVVLPGGAQ